MSLPWYKHNARDFLDGVSTLTLEERGAYITVLDLIYLRGGPVPDEPRFLAGHCLASVRAWKKLRAALILKGKLFEVNFNGQPSLANTRAAAELAPKSAETSAKPQDNSDETSAKVEYNIGETEPEVNEIKDLVPAIVRAVVTESVPLDRDREVEREQEVSDASASSVGGADEAVDLWNALARKLGLPIAKSIDRARKAAIKARLAEGGLDAWREALTAVERSPHCRGENDRGWRADIDFVCQPKSWRRLLEGFYGGSDPVTAGPAIVFSGPADLRAAIVAECGEDFCLAYLDPCGWRDIPRALIPRTRFAADKLRREAGAVLGDVQIEERAA
jgi:uncharacterized protein YdaU (DUF1376 family)